MPTEESEFPAKAPISRRLETKESPYNLYDAGYSENRLFSSCTSSMLLGKQNEIAVHEYDGCRWKLVQNMQKSAEYAKKIKKRFEKWRKKLSARREQRAINDVQ